MQRAPGKPVFKNAMVLLLAAGIVVFSIGIKQGDEFSGTDGQAQNAISEINPGYKPWFDSIWSPPGNEVESLLFALQAALGSGFIGYYFGARERKKRQRKKCEECCK